MTIPIMYQQEFESAMKSHKLTDLYPLTTRISEDVDGDRIVYDHSKTLYIHVGYCMAKHEQIMQEVKDGKCQTTDEILADLE